MRVRRKAWTEKEIETNDLIIKNAESFKGNWGEYFGNNNPIHVEIGCGKGRFITTTASQNKEINYLAIEREKHVLVMGARASKEIDCSLGFILGDVKDLENYFCTGEIKRIYINFCDPWQNRKKWHKRRLTHSNFLSMYERLFEDYGEIHFKTDNTELFEFTLNEFSKKRWQLKNISLDLHKSEFLDNVMTEYEEKFSSKGMPIYRCEGLYGKTN